MITSVKTDTSWYSLSICSIIFLVLSILPTFSQPNTQQSPTEIVQTSEINYDIWSTVYWRRLAAEGRVAVTPQDNNFPPQAVYTGSSINAHTVLTDNSPDVPVTSATNTTQSENSIFVNPFDNTKVLNSNNSTPFPVTTVLGSSGFMSSNGGLSWNGQIQGTGGTNSGDPAVVISAATGTYFVGYIANNGGNGCAYSTNEGTTWTHVQVAPNPGSLADKNHLWIDNSPSSPYFGYLYAAWTDFGGVNNNNVVVSRSTDDGRSWSPPVNVTGALPGLSQGVNMQTGPNGEVYAFYASYNAGGVGDEPAYGMTRSTDGGATWETARRIITGTRGIRGTGTSKNMRVPGFPGAAADISDRPSRGNLYMVWANIGVPGVNIGPEIDVYLIKSTDSGDTWSAPVRVNQDSSGQGKEHYFPWITCDPENGALGVIMYDDRNVSSTQCEVYVATSIDAGDTWEDFKVSDVAFTPAPIPGLAGGYFGDYIGISSRGGQAYPVWTDNRTGAALAYVSPIILVDPESPESPDSLTAYSDYQSPNGMQLRWTDPTNLALGDTLLPGDFRVIISRDGSIIDSVDGGTGQYTDSGLNDGQSYSYEIFSKVIVNQKISRSIAARWIAGGSPVPNGPLSFSVGGDRNMIVVNWSSPTRNIDNTPMDDYAGINLYQDGLLVANFTRTSSDTGIVGDSESYTPAAAGFYNWQISVIDNETPQNESVRSPSQGTPLSIPISDNFDFPGDPNPSVWDNSNGDINDRSDMPPSGTTALNLNGRPVGADTVALKPLNLSGFEGSGVQFSYYYQPQGSGNRPETDDSLWVQFKNDLDEWITIRRYEGTDVVPFQQEIIDIEAESAGGGTFLHGQFQARFRNRGGSGNLPNDDWFVDDVQVDLPVGINDGSSGIPQSFAVSANYPNPFNPSTTIDFQVAAQSRVQLTVFNLLGQAVKVLVDQDLQPGRYKSIWDGLSDSGKPASSGIYFYRFSAGGFEYIGKMMLLK